MSAVIERLTTLRNILTGAKETLTGGITNINSDHSLIHKGYGYEFATQFTLGNAASEEIGITTSATLFTHLKALTIEVIGESVDLQMFTGSTFTGGTSIPTYNHNHNSSNTADMAMVLNPTVSADGTAVTAQRRVLSDTSQTNKTTTIVVQNPDQEYVLKDGSTKYILRATNTGTSDTRVAITGFFYEETQGLS